MGAFCQQAMEGKDIKKLGKNADHYAKNAVMEKAVDAGKGAVKDYMIDYEGAEKFEFSFDKNHSKAFKFVYNDKQKSLRKADGIKYKATTTEPIPHSKIYMELKVDEIKHGLKFGFELEKEKKYSEIKASQCCYYDLQAGQVCQQAKYDAVKVTKNDTLTMIVDIPSKVVKFKVNGIDQGKVDCLHDIFVENRCFAFVEMWTEPSQVTFS